MYRTQHSSEISRLNGNSPANFGSSAMQKVVDGALAGCLFLVPLLMAGRHPLGQAVFVSLAAVAAIGWTVDGAMRRRARFRPTWAAPLLFCAVGVLVVQILPLPEAIVGRISPALYRFLPMWDARTEPALRLGTWRTLSLTPAATRDGLILLSAYALLFFVVVQRGKCLEDVEGLLRWTAAAAAVTAIYGLIQFVTSNGKFFWFYEDPTSTTFDAVKANFTTRNHFAHFLALGVGPLVWWVQSLFAHSSSRARPDRIRPTAAGYRPEIGSGESVRAYGLAACLGLVLFAGLLSLSRGGMVAIAVAFGLAAAISWRSWSSNRGFLAAVAAALLFLVALLSIFGYEKVNRRIDDFRARSFERLDQVNARRSIWLAVLRGIREFSLIGAGVGSHVEAYPIFYSPELYRDGVNKEFTHAECSYLQIGLETGIIGLGILGGVMLCCCVWCIGGLIAAQSQRVVGCLAAVTGGLAATAVHATVDFIWYVPACVAMIVILAACAANLWRLSRASHRHADGDDACGATARSGWMLPRAAYLFILAVLAPAAIWAIRDQARSAWAELPWNEYRRSLAALSRSSSAGTADAAQGMEFRHADQSTEIRHVELLRAAIARQPDRARAHLYLAQSYLRLFEMIQIDQENPMRVSDVRDAVLRSRFASRSALDEWLGRAVGEHARYLDMAFQHARRALALCPLQGHGYLYLAELCFLDNGNEAWKRACIDQAVRLRPYDGDVLDTAASELIASGDYERATEIIGRLLRCHSFYQRRWIERLVQNTAAEALMAMLQAFVQTFQPDADVLRIMVECAGKRVRPEHIVWLRREYARRAADKAQSQQSTTAAQWWNEAQKSYAAAQDAALALQCAENAVRCDPQNFDARFALGNLLLAEGRIQEAEPHLRWCVQRRPGDARVEARWKEAVKKRLDNPPATARRNAPHQTM